MLIEVFASGSGGNSYYCSDGQTSLLLEAGLRENALKNLLWQSGIMTANLDGCLVSHEHNDHSASAAYLSKMGVTILASKGTLDAVNGIVRKKILRNGEQANFYSFDILPFKVQHDAAEPLGFLIQSKVTGEKLLYATDTYYLKAKIPAVDYLMIEANYDLDIMRRNVNEDRLNEALAKRILQSHMSIDHLIDALKAADLSRLQAVYLMHLSDDNSNAEEFKERVQRVTGVRVIVC